jgi:hypothetical protein
MGKLPPETFEKSWQKKSSEEFIIFNTDKIKNSGNI